MRSLVISVAAIALVSAAQPTKADGLFAGVGATSDSVFAGVALGNTPFGRSYTTYSAASVSYIPAAAIRYNRPCSVTDGFRTVAIPCDAAAAYTVGSSYAAVGYPVYGEAIPRYGWRHHHRRYHHHVIRRLY